MKKEVILVSFLAFSLILSLLLFPFVSAEIIIVQNPNSLYNLGDIVTVPIKITSSIEKIDVFTINLVCENSEKLLYYEQLTVNGELQKNLPFLLTKGFIGNSIGTCRLRYVFGSETKTTSDFTISKIINVAITSQAREFAPLQKITIEGTASKENGKPANGYVEAELLQGGENSATNIFGSDTVRNGVFSLNFSLPKETASGNYILKVNVYEKDINGEITNTGFANYNIFVTQTATNLEIFMEDSSVSPDSSIFVKAILRDQTGQPISSSASLTVINEKGKTVEQSQVSTDEFVEIKIPYNQVPATWKIKASSNELSGEILFSILALEQVKTEITGNTLIVTNTGNVPYNKPVEVKIGEHVLSVPVELAVGQSQKYSLKAPDGTYDVEVVADGQSSLTQSIPLTGKAINISEAGFSLENNTIIWVLIILILAFFGTRLFKRWYSHHRSFSGFMPSMSSFTASKKEEINLKKTSLITRNKAEVELSIKGDQQDVSLVCLKIKNIDKLRESKTDYEPILQNIIEMAESGKAYINGAQENIFIIYAPMKTKTFRNEKTAVELAKKITETIEAYNKLAREKINFGVSVNHGTIVAAMQPNSNVLKFMSLGTLMNSSKKLASVSDGEILISDKIRAKLGSEVKTQKKEAGGMEAFTIRETRYDERSNEFIRKFMDRMQKEK